MGRFPSLETQQFASAILWDAMKGMFHHDLSVLKRCVPKTLAFAFGLRLRSKTRCFKTGVLGRRLPNGKPQERLRFRALRGKTLAFKKRIAIIFLRFKDFPRGQGLRLGRLRSKNAAFCVYVSKPAKVPPQPGFASDSAVCRRVPSPLNLFLGVVLPHLPVGKKFLRFCLV